MQITKRAYPHPVLSYFGDDYCDRLFQPAIDVKPNKSFFRVMMSCNTSSTSLRELIQAKRAAYCIHVECASTRYRAVFTSFDRSFEVDIPVSDLEGKVEVSRLIVCTEPVTNYSSSEFHSDFSGRSFDLRVGDVLAVAETAEFPAIKKDDELARLPSIFSIIPAVSDDAATMDVDLSGDKIVVTLSKPVHQKLSDLNSSVEARTTLMSMIHIPALVFTISTIRSHDDPGELLNRRWYRVLHKRFSDFNIDLARIDENSDSDVVLAGILMDSPLAKAVEDLDGILISYGEDGDE